MLFKSASHNKKEKLDSLPSSDVFVGSNMPCLNANDLHRIFQQLDKNGDGLVSVDELQWLIDKIGSHQTNPGELQELLGGRTVLDSIDFYFFYDALIKNPGVACTVGCKGSDLGSDDLWKAFKVFDLNGDGFINCEELEKVLSRLGLWDKKNGQDCQMMINMYDQNSDGMLDFEEFKVMMLPSDSN